MTEKCFLLFALLLVSSSIIADELQQFEDITMQVIGLDEELSGSIGHLIAIPPSPSSLLTSQTESLMRKQTGNSTINSLPNTVTSTPTPTTAMAKPQVEKRAKALP